MSAQHDYFNWPVYGMRHDQKSTLLATVLTGMTWRHAERCEPYARILSAHGYQPGQQFKLENVPFLPVSMFKNYDLHSTESEKIFKVLTSSGTTSQKVSRITLDHDTSIAQTKALVFILQDFLGKSRLPMLIIDHPGVIKNRHSFSARGAGILGLSNFGRDHTYALKDEDMAPDIDAIQSFISRNRGKKVFLFGFTFMVWKYFFQTLKDLPEHPVFDDALLIHSGGWKKLQDEAVDNDSFKNVMRNKLGIRSIHNFYGMVEQVGSIFMECEHGRLHAPAFADVIIRDAQDWSVLPISKPGLVQVLSVIPESYPGHSLLTEDIGELLGIDDCPCGRLGKTFRIHGRVPRAELRGCSDTHEISDKNSQKMTA
jgi:phenylacetate-coenzyme A ligase PaaK-like adenylate-forming protein